MRLIPFLICLLWAGASYGQWNTNIWPSSKTYFDGRKRSIQCYSGILERATIADQTNAFHGAVSYPGFFTQRSSLIEYKDKIEELIPVFVNMTHTNASGNFQDYFQDDVNRTNETQHPGSADATFPNQVRARLPEWSVTGLLAHVGAPTNYLDVTPWFKLNTVSNGWLFIPSILNEMVAISAGMADDELAGERWGNPFYDETMAWTNTDYTAPGKSGANWTTLFNGLVSDLQDSTQWGVSNGFAGGALHAWGDAAVGSRGAYSNVASGNFFLFDAGDVAARGNHASIGGTSTDKAHTNFAVQAQTYAMAGRFSTLSTGGYAAVEYVNIWSNAVTESLSTSIYPYVFFDVRFEADPANSNIVISIPIETNAAEIVIDFGQIPNTAPTNEGTGEREWAQYIHGDDSGNRRPMQMLLNYGVSNGFKFVHIDGIAP